MSATIFGNEPLDAGISIGRLTLSLIGAAEREAMLERQREKIAKAKRKGRYKGRVATGRRWAAEVIRLKSECIRPAKIARK